MKNRLKICAAGLLAAISIYGCTKSSQSYSNGVNHAIGMTNSRTWSGTSTGYAQGDTTEGDDTVAWPKYFNRNITDTTFAITAVDGFVIQFGATVARYSVTDSSNGTVTFDSIITGTLNTVVTYYYPQDSITISYYDVSGLNKAAGIGYYTNTFLYSHH